MQADIEGAVRIACLGAGFDWTWKIDEVEPWCAASGWQMPELTGSFNTTDTGLSVNKPLGYVRLEPDEFSCLAETHQDVRLLTAVVSDWIDPGAPVRGLTDCFHGLAVALRAELGDPARVRAGAEPTIQWDRPKVTVFLGCTENYVALSLRNPMYQQFPVSYEYYHQIDDEDGEVVEIDSGPRPVGERWREDWPGFTEAVAMTMAGTPGSGSFTLSAEGTRYGHFSVGSLYTGGYVEKRGSNIWTETESGFQLRCSISRNSAMDERFRLSGEQQSRLVADGWTRPNKRSDWQQVRVWPIPYCKFLQSADKMVSALRDHLSVGDPTDLTITTDSRIPDEPVNIELLVSVAN